MTDSPEHQGGARMSPEACDHTDAYGSAVVEGGPDSAYPGKAMCIICDQPAPFLTLLDRVYNGMPSGRVSMQYTVTGPLIDVDVEDGHFSASCPACPGWTAAADSWNALFDLVSEWHADGAPHRGWSMQPSFIVNGSTTNRVKLEVATPIRAGEGVDIPRYATVEKFADYADPAPVRPDALAVLERITVVADRRPAHRGKVVSHDLEEVHSPNDPCDICAAIAVLRSEQPR